MDTAVSAITQLIPGKSQVQPAVVPVRAHSQTLNMLESTGGPGQVPAPPIPQLILSQAMGPGFHYRCDLGAGPFSGHSLPLDFVIVVPNAHTWCQIDNPHRLRFLGIPMDLARQFLNRDDRDPLDFGRLHSRQNRDPFIAQTMDTLWQELIQGDPSCQLFADTAVASLMVRLERLARQSDANAVPRGGLAAWQTTRVIDCMRAHLDQPLRLHELAQLVGLSPWHFARAFRQSHGRPPHQYLMQLRLQKACELLTNSAASITDIASMSGYSPQHLARHFQRAFGCSPREYRRRSQQ